MKLSVSISEVLSSNISSLFLFPSPHCIIIRNRIAWFWVESSVIVHSWALFSYLYFRHQLQQPSYIFFLNMAHSHEKWGNFFWYTVIKIFSSFYVDKYLVADEKTRHFALKVIFSFKVLFQERLSHHLQHPSPNKIDSIEDNKLHILWQNN